MSFVPFIIIVKKHFRSKNIILLSLNWIGMIVGTFLHKWWRRLVIGLSSLRKLRGGLGSDLNPAFTDGDAFYQRNSTARGSQLLPVTCRGHLVHNLVMNKRLNLLWLFSSDRVVIRQDCRRLWCNYAVWMISTDANTSFTASVKVECYVIHFGAIKQAGHDAWNVLVGQLLVKCLSPVELGSILFLIEVIWV